MTSPFVISQKQKPEEFSLIIDKEGLLGCALAQSFSKDSTVVFVSKATPSADSTIIHIPFKETIPEIPDSQYRCILYVFSKENKDLLEPVMRKAKEDKTRFLIVVAYEYMPLLSEWLISQEKYGSVIVLGDVFGKGEGEIDEWLSTTKKTKKILLPNMGLLSWYPVLFQDVVQSIKEICFSTHMHEVYLLAPSHPLTQLTLSHVLQKVDPLLRIDFGREEKSNHSSLPEGISFLKDYDVVKKMQTYYQQMLVKEESEKSPFPVVSSFTKENFRKKKRKSSLPFIIYTLMIFILMPAILMLIAGGLGKWLLLSGIDDIKHGAFPAAFQKIEAAKSNISFSQFSSTLVERELSVVGQAGRLNQIKQQLSLATLTANALGEGVFAAQKIQSVIEGKSLKPTEDTKDGVNSLKNTLVMVQKLQTYDLPKEYQEKLAMVVKLFPLIENTVDVFPQLIGADGERQYLVLFQNNTELRPGGGFIGSYGLLKLSHGKFKEFTIHDVYDADGLLKGHVEPPFVIRRYLPLVHLYLRDSNFDIDFVKSAQKASFMLTAETGDKVDGVIGVDLSLVQKIIGATGIIYVPSYNEKVTQDNFFLLTEQHAEKNFFAGSTQKKEFLSALFTALQDKLSSQHGGSYEHLIDAGLTGIEEKHLLFAFSDPSVQAPFSVSGLSSALLDNRKEDKATLNDFLGINEANIGIDKVNYFIQRNVTHKVVVTDKGQVKESVRLTFANTSKGQWPGGDYKNYLRFIVPTGASLDSVTIDGQDQKILPAVTDPLVYEAKYFTAPKGLEVEKTEEGGKSVWGFLVTVPVSSSKTVVISYTLSQAVDLSQAISHYSLQLFKQPGVDALPYSVELSYLQGFSLLSSSKNIGSTTNVVVWNSDVRKDDILDFSFAKK